MGRQCQRRVDSLESGEATPCRRLVAGFTASISRATGSRSFHEVLRRPSLSIWCFCRPTNRLAGFLQSSASAQSRWHLLQPSELLGMYRCTQPPAKKGKRESWICLESSRVGGEWCRRGRERSALRRRKTACQGRSLTYSPHCTHKVGHKFEHHVRHDCCGITANRMLVAVSPH